MKERLNEIDLLRPFVIFLLVIMHSFTMYWGNWPLPEGIDNYKPYYWIAKLSYSCMLETFTFISGYLFAYSLSKGPVRFYNLATKKFKRLIIPSIFFSVIYLLSLKNETNVFSIDFVYNAINGAGHMWYLPMLFWCFIFTFFLNKIAIKEEIKLIGLFFFSVLTCFPIPFQIGSSFYYLFFFYLGFYFFPRRSHFKTISNKDVFKLVGVYMLFICLTYPIFKVENLRIYLQGTAFEMAQSLWRTIYTLLGVFILYMTCIRISSKHKVLSEISNFNKYCFGIYLIHQFIIEFIYYKTNCPIIFGTYILPWITFIITFILSYLFSKLLLKTSFGRFLIG